MTDNIPVNDSEQFMQHVRPSAAEKRYVAESGQHTIHVRRGDEDVCLECGETTPPTTIDNELEATICSRVVQANEAVGDTQLLICTQQLLNDITTHQNQLLDRLLEEAKHFARPKMYKVVEAEGAEVSEREGTEYITAVPVEAIKKMRGTNE